MYTFKCKEKLINPKYLLFGMFGQEVDQSLQMQKKIEEEKCPKNQNNSLIIYCKLYNFDRIC